MTLERTYSNNNCDNSCFKFNVYRNIYHDLGVIDLETRSPSKSCMVYKESFLKIQENKPILEINLKLEGTWKKDTPHGISMSNPYLHWSYSLLL